MLQKLQNLQNKLINRLMMLAFLMTNNKLLTRFVSSPQELRHDMQFFSDRL